MKPRKQTEPGAGFIYEDEQPDGHHLRDRLAEQFGDVTTEVKGKRPSRIDGVGDRTWESVRPLVNLADRVGGDWPVTVRRAITALVAGQPTTSNPRAYAC